MRQQLPKGSSTHSTLLILTIILLAGALVTERFAGEKRILRDPYVILRISEADSSLRILLGRNHGGVLSLHDHTPETLGFSAKNVRQWSTAATLRCGAEWQHGYFEWKPFFRRRLYGQHWSCDPPI